MQNFMIYLLFFAFSYLLGSIPFSYLVSKFLGKKNIMEMGWKKSSASNVIKNVGKWHGILAFLLDVAKGFLAVYLAQRFGFSPLMQALCGIFAIIGHNWSIFLSMKGGRGLAALVGAILAFNPLFLTIILLPCILFTFIWTASIGTILSFITGIFLGLAYRPWQPMAILLIIALIPVTIKRLSPWKEISDASDDKKRELIENRLLFDQDGVPAFRLKALKKSEKENNIQK